MVTVWIKYRSSGDADVYRAMLDEVLSDWDHTILADEYSQGEVIALAVSRAMGVSIGAPDDVVEVLVSRPTERIFAKWAFPQPQPAEIR